jgi:hypothetical protein
VDQAFWSTRTEHIVGVAACLAVTEHISENFFSSCIGTTELCFTKVFSHVSIFIIFLFIFTFESVRTLHPPHFTRVAGQTPATLALHLFVFVSVGVTI